MNRIVKIFATGFLSVWALTASAQNGEGDTKESLFNPVNYAVISQTIAPDARGGGLGDVGGQPIRMSTRSIGIRQSIPSTSPGRAWR